MFSRAGLVCPRCRGSSRDPEAACPRCGFDFAACEKSFPFGAPPLSLIIDPAHLLPSGIERDIAPVYQKFRKRLPQIECSFCFVQLAAGAATQEFAFWLHNAAPGAGDSRAWQILVVGDLAAGRLALTAGYALEPFIKAERWEAALQEFAACIADWQWKEGFHGFLTDARDLLTNAWSTAEQRRQKSQRRIREEASARRTNDPVAPDGSAPQAASPAAVPAPAPHQANPQPKVRADRRAAEDPAAS